MTSPSLSRRHILAGGAGLAAFAALSSTLASQPVFAADDISAVAEAAAIWGYPLVQTGRYLALSQSKGFGLNQFHLNPKLATPSLKVPGPNVDTIYGFAWLDLAKEPLVLDVPDTQDRYYSIQLVDAYENTFAYVGRRETGTKAGTYVIAGPGWKGKTPTGAKVIAAPTSLVLALTRTLVRGEADAPVAADVQLHYTLSPLSTYPAGKQAGIVQDDVLNILPALNLKGTGAAYFDELDKLVRAYPPTGPEAQTFAQFKALGLGTPAFAPKRPSDDVLAAAFDKAYAKVAAFNNSDIVNGWRVNFHISKFIKDPLERAAVNRYGPGAHIAEEALYYSAVGDASGQPLSGANRYSLTFPAGQIPPVDAFWSLILYGPDFFLVDNPLNRYAINDRTPGLVKGADGSLTLLIQHDAPADQSNWLPAPDGKFQLLFRTYQPKPAILDRSYKLPPLQRL
jgi:hypothetical protein